MAKIINITDYFGKTRKKPKGRPVELPDKYAVWVQRLETGDIIFDFSEDKFINTKQGLSIVSEDFLAIICSVCYHSNPQDILELADRLKEYVENRDEE